MRLTRIVPLLPLASALVITDTDVFQNVEKSGRSIIDNAQSVLDDAIGKAHQTYDKMKDEAKSMYSKVHDVSYDISAWLEGSSFDDGDFDFEADHEHCDHPPHATSWPPPHGPPHHGKPHHPPHDEKPNRTVYELISESNYTTKLAKLINEYDELVKLLNGTEANYTVFAPTDKAFENIPDHGKKPSKEALKSILLYHVSDDFYPAGRVLHSYTIPTLYEPEKLLGHKQRLTVRITLRGPTINFYSKLVATNIFATNGVIHGVDSILIPPPSVASIIDLLPSEFSTLELGLSKTGLWDKLNGTKYAHEGGTFFTPSNTAFKKLGPRINAFLFSSYGQKYLKALLEYHIVVNQTLYTDAFYDATSDGGDEDEADRPPYFHYDLPTVLNGKYLAVDVTRYGPFVSIRINKFSRVTVHDGIASDGVIQVVSNVLIPPRNAKSGEEVFWEGEEMSVEELKERLEPYVVDENMEL
ncbi:FAS1 domain-containing protein [Phaeosphaeriaceae sp. PMI808]|nr:FAS1 domain-containing protein [Phaeosphaeriaceae sp. PMI808]